MSPSFRQSFTRATAVGANFCQCLAKLKCFASRELITGQHRLWQSQYIDFFSSRKTEELDQRQSNSYMSLFISLNHLKILQTTFIQCVYNLRHLSQYHFIPSYIGMRSNQKLLILKCIETMIQIREFKFEKIFIQYRRHVLNCS